MSTQEIHIPTPIGCLIGQWQRVAGYDHFTISANVKPASAIYHVHAVFYAKDGQHQPVRSTGMQGVVRDTEIDIVSIKSWAQAPDKTRRRILDSIRLPILDAIERTAPR